MVVFILESARKFILRRLLASFFFGKPVTRRPTHCVGKSQVHNAKVNSVKKASVCVGMGFFFSFSGGPFLWGWNLADLVQRTKFGQEMGCWTIGEEIITFLAAFNNLCLWWNLCSKREGEVIWLISFDPKWRVLPGRTKTSFKFIVNKLRYAIDRVLFAADYWHVITVICLNCDWLDACLSSCVIDDLLKYELKNLIDSTQSHSFTLKFPQNFNTY